MGYEKQGKIISSKLIELVGIALASAILLGFLIVGHVRGLEATNICSQPSTWVVPCKPLETPVLSVQPYNQKWSDITEPSDLQPAVGYKYIQN